MTSDDLMLKIEAAYARMKDEKKLFLESAIKCAVGTSAQFRHFLKEKPRAPCPGPTHTLHD
jgi:hypothetical protein